MTTLKNRLKSIQSLIETTKSLTERVNDDIKLLAVSKTWPAEKLRELAEAGQQQFGENYLQEALSKIKALSDLNLEWHFIGPIQSNKTQDIAQNFDWVQSLDRIKIAKRLSAQRPDDLTPLNVCIQVNIDQEESKSGLTASDVLPFAAELSSFENLLLRGLMVIPAQHEAKQAQRDAFRRSNELYQRLKSQFPSVDTLSMGMSGDMDIAIAEGSTMVRVGTALFGKRVRKPN